MPRTRSSRRAVSGETARLPWMTSFSRGNDTPIRLAKSICLMPSGRMNSCRSISPGWVGGLLRGSRTVRILPEGRSRRLVVVGDFDPVGISSLPTEAHPALGVDPNTVLSGSISAESLQPSARRDR
jgi:hypothetical protein